MPHDGQSPIEIPQFLRRQHRSLQSGDQVRLKVAQPCRSAEADLVKAGMFGTVMSIRNHFAVGDGLAPIDFGGLQMWCLVADLELIATAEERREADAFFYNQPTDNVLIAPMSDNDPFAGGREFCGTKTVTAAIMGSTMTADLDGVRVTMQTSGIPGAPGTYSLAEEGPRPWRWRNLRHVEIAVSLQPFPWDWRCRWTAIDDDGAGGCYGMKWAVQIGPLCLGLHVTPGNCSEPGWRGRLGLSEEEVWDRSLP